jgi:hypothetical protein
MLKGIQLSLFIGPSRPRPVAQDVIEALNSVEISSKSYDASGFQLRFELSNRSPLHSHFLLQLGSGLSVVRVVIAVTLNGTPQVLADGVMTTHQAVPAARGYTSVSVTGEDLTRIMDYQELDGFPFPALPPHARVRLILAKYAGFGVGQTVIPSPFPELPNPLEKIRRQQGTDLAYIRKLAEEAGHVFYLEPGPRPGASTAYWGPAIKHGRVQKALTTNMDDHSNVDEISFSYNGEGKTTPIAMIQTPLGFPIPVPIGDPGVLNPTLGRVSPLAKRFELLKDGAANESLSQAMTKALAVASKTADVVQASGSLDVLRYGGLLQPRQLVAVRGAGLAFDGEYYVESVSHQIRRGQFKQQFTLSRNALVAKSERVAV